jgi:hypothetical protein
VTFPLQKYTVCSQDIRKRDVCELYLRNRYNYEDYWFLGATRRRGWSRHYVTCRKVTGSISDEDIRFLDIPHNSSSTMALGSTQPLIKMSTRNISGVNGRPAPSVILMFRKSWSLDVSKPYGSPRPGRYLACGHSTGDRGSRLIRTVGEYPPKYSASERERERERDVGTSQR